MSAFQSACAPTIATTMTVGIESVTLLGNWGCAPVSDVLMVAAMTAADTTSTCGRDEHTAANQTARPVTQGQVRSERPGSRRTARQAQPNPSGDGMSFVYFIVDDDLEAIKIGHSKRPWSRLAEMQTANSRTLHMAVCWPSRDARRFERALHDALYRHHVRGEWFRALPLAHVVQVAADVTREFAGRPIPDMQEFSLCLLACGDTADRDPGQVAS